MSAVLLVPTDLSSSARRAMRLAAQIAPSLDADILLLHVTALPPGLLESSQLKPFPGAPPTTAGELVRSASIAELERYAKELKATYGAQARCRVEIGEPVAEVLRVADEIEPVLIVMGTHGRTGLTHLLIGSVAEKVIRRAGRPVLTVPQRGSFDEDFPSEARVEVDPRGVTPGR